MYTIDGHACSGLEIVKNGILSPEESIISYNDLGRGAEQRLIEQKNLSEEAASLAVAATKAFGLRSGLVDLIWDEKARLWKVLELNNDDFGKVRDRSERLHRECIDGGIFDWNQRLAEALTK